MWIAAGRVVIDCDGIGNENAKHKRIEELATLLRRKFNVSALEIADQDSLNRAVFGFAAVIPENWKERSAREFLETLARTIDENAFGRVIVEDCELLVHGEEGPMIDDDDIDYGQQQARNRDSVPRSGITDEGRARIQRLRQRR